MEEDDDLLTQDYLSITFLAAVQLQRCYYPSSVNSRTRHSKLFCLLCALHSLIIYKVFVFATNHFNAANPQPSQSRFPKTRSDSISLDVLFIPRGINCFVRQEELFRVLAFVEIETKPIELSCSF